MINEVAEVKGYLDGKNLNKKNLYRICYLLAKWHKEQGLTHVEIRNSIFDWANQYHVFIKYSLNSIIYKALDDKNRLRDNIVIKINKGDIDEISNRFDSKNTKLVALAVLCFSKAYADRDKTFNISSKALASWLNMDDSNLRKRHIKELVDFGYLSKISSPQNTYTWSNTNPTCEFKINVDIHNSGNYVLVDNEILDLYSEIFS